jgi:glycosyltransferase involved in cell wall biosynthesis
MERIPFLRTIVREPLYLWEVWQGLEHADVVHIFSASYWSFLLAPAPAAWLARLRGRKALIHYHSGEASDHLQRFPSARRALRKVDAMVVPSQYLVDVFREFDLHPESIPNVTELERFQFRERRPLRPHFICTRGFSPYYCVDVVVRAFAELKKTFPDAQLDLVGGGPLEANIRSLVQELSLTGVNFAGVVPHADIHRYYEQADIFINASRLDNMPVSILEAFAAGTPVVTTSPECMPYLVEHGRTGLLSPVGDPIALARNIAVLLRDPELASRLARNAREESRNFQWGSVRGQWLNVYNRLLGGKSQTAATVLDHVSH